MNIKGISYTNIINQYNKVASNKINKLEKVEVSDRIELSREAKILSNYKLDENAYDNSKKVIEIKNKIQNGTYNVNSNLLSKELVNTMRGIEE